MNRQQSWTLSGYKLRRCLWTNCEAPETDEKM